MNRLIVLLTLLIFSASSAPAGPSAPKALKDLYFGEALYCAFQGDWFDAIAGSTPSFCSTMGWMNQSATAFITISTRRSSTWVISNWHTGCTSAPARHQGGDRGNVEEPVRNEAIFRLARLYFQKDQPQNALQP